MCFLECESNIKIFLENNFQENGTKNIKTSSVRLTKQLAIAKCFLNHHDLLQKKMTILL